MADINLLSDPEAFWESMYPQGVSRSISCLPYHSLSGYFDYAVKKYADRPAFRSFGVDMSYAQTEAEVNRLADFLMHDFALSKGERVCIMLPNSLVFPVSVFAILQAGLTVVNVNPLYTPRELAHQLKDAQADAIIIMENFAHVLEKALPFYALKKIIIVRAADLLGWRGYFISFILHHIRKEVPSFNLPGAVYYKKIAARAVPKEKACRKTVTTDIAFLQYTGGTTGVSKGAILTHGNLLANLQQIKTYCASVFAVSDQHRITTALPLYHIFSLTANLFTFFFLGSHNLLIINPRDIARFLKDWSRFPGVTFFSGVNTLFRVVAEHPLVKTIDFSQILFVLSGGTALQQTVAERWHQVTGTYIAEAYGLSETSPAVCISPYRDRVFTGSVGLPLPSTEICILSLEGEKLGLNQPGELAIRGPQVMSGYWRVEDSSFTEDGFFKTGDIAVIDDQGLVRIVDRKKDLIIVSGFNVYPNEIEEVLSHCASIAEVAVISEHSERSGERPLAVVVLRPGMSMTEKEILLYASERLTRYKVPKRVLFREVLPKSTVGKILRRQLREQLLAEGLLENVR